MKVLAKLALCVAASGLLAGCSGAVATVGSGVQTDSRGVTSVGNPDAAVVVDIFEDPLCPYCSQLEARDGEQLQAQVDVGTVQVKYHVLNFLDTLSASGDYSSRAAGALQCVAATGDANAYSAFHAWMLSPENQPAESASTDLSNANLGVAARGNGVAEDAVSCITEGKKTAEAREFAQDAATDLQAAGANGTPTVLVNGEMVNALGDPSWVDTLTK
jgi:protein-disulfide isomerase